MTRHSLLPVTLGAIMGAMMLWMLHSQIMTGDSVSDWGPLLFVGAHVAVAILALGIARFGLSRFATVRRIMPRMHRPSLNHMGVMLSSAVGAAMALHVLLHGVAH